MQTIQPVLDRVLIQRIDEPYKGGIVIPDVAQEKSFKGKVLAVGPGKHDDDGDLIPLDVAPGDIVYFNSKWNDFAEDHFEAGVLVPKGQHLVQEADIIGKC